MTQQQAPTTQPRTSARPPLGPGARRIMAWLSVISGLRAAGLVLFAASVATLLTVLAREAFRVVSSGKGPEASSDWADFVGSHSAGADGLFPSWLTGIDPGHWAWQIAAWGVAGLAIRALADWALSVASQRAASSTKSELRRRLLEAVLHRSSTSAGARIETDGDSESSSDGGIAVLASRGLDAVDDYYVKSLTAMCSSAVIPVVLLLVVLWLDPISALVLVLTLPLVPLFMILIGKTTQQDTREAQTQLLRLSSHIVELSRGLPVLFGLRRNRAQAQALDDLGENYRRRTLTTLRSAFQSSLALELITTISVALVAVFIGLRLVTGSIGLDTALAVLLIAPECFQPLRDLGSAFHQSQDGIDALRRAEAVVERGRAPQARQTNQDGGVRVRHVSVAYPGRGPVLTDVNLDISAGSTTVVVGPSGGGKSTLLKVLGGMIDAMPAEHQTPTVLVPSETAWISQTPSFLAATVYDEMGLYTAPEFAETWLAEVDDNGSVQGKSLEAPASDGPQSSAVDSLIRAALTDLGLQDLRDVAPSALSAGQARRLAVARVLARVRGMVLDAGSSRQISLLVLVDEPTAHLDDRAAASVAGALREIASYGSTVIWVTHDPTTVPHAEYFLEVPGDGQVVVTASRTQALDGARLTKDAAHGDRHAVDIPQAEGQGTDAPRDDYLAGSEGNVASRSVVQTLGSLKRITGARLTTALGPLAVNFLTVAFGASLTALSGWLIVRASQQPGMMYLMVAIVGVRFFGLGRASFRYAERLLTHDVVLRAANRLRMTAWRTVGESALSLRTLLRGGAFLDRLVGDVDELRDAMPRVLLPIATNIPVMVGAVVVTSLTVPSATWLVGVAACMSTFCLPWAVTWADRRAESIRRTATSRTLRGVVGMTEAAEDLRGNSLGPHVLRVFRHWDADSLNAARRSAFAAGLGNATTLGLWWLTALLIGLVAWAPVSSGQISAPVAAIPVLLCTALVEPAAQTTDALRAWPAFARLVAKIDRGVPEELPGSRTDHDSETTRHNAQTLRIQNVSARWPGMERPAVRGVSGGVERGQALGLTGPSGSGKSTSLAVLLGFLRPEQGEVIVDGVKSDPETLRGVSAWCPQDAYIFDSTVRGNLALAKPRGQAPGDDELYSVLDRVGLGDVVRGFEDGLDTRVGAGGSNLSGGQRQRLAVARALLTEASFLLLDEPTAHLDHESAQELMEEIDRATRLDAHGESGPGTIIISHRPADLVYCADVIALK